MAFTREQIEGQITAQMKELGAERPDTIQELLGGAKKGAGRAEREVVRAQDALRQAKTEEEKNKLNATIGREGRYAALEHERIAMLNQIAKEDEKKQQL